MYYMVHFINMNQEKKNGFAHLKNVITMYWCIGGTTLIRMTAGYHRPINLLIQKNLQYIRVLGILQLDGYKTVFYSMN